MKFSVLMSLYQKEDPAFLDRAIQSIWDDQILKPDEIVIVKDGPLNDQLDKILDQWKLKINPALKIIPLKENIGLGKALNIGIKSCSAEIIARMDTDDISLPTRFLKQIEFLKNNPDIDVLSAYIEEIDPANEKRIALKKVPLRHDKIRSYAKFRNPMNHTAAVFRKQKVQQAGNYPPFDKSQDYGLWSNMLHQGYKFANLGEILVKVRAGRKLLQSRNKNYFHNELMVLKYQAEIGFISSFQFYRNSIIRSLYRQSPLFLKSLIYRLTRS